ncbi:MAG: hypothetical protein KAH20_05635 [Methylococcales bacterium]|nr:hypothetical protein [Methylococcales bacterium]
MSEDNFREQVKQGVEKLNRQQKIQFSWRCAVRALPFLVGSHGTFGFWNNEKRQTHLYSVFYALDNSIYAAVNDSATTEARAAAFKIAKAYAAVYNDIAADINPAYTTANITDDTVTYAAENTITNMFANTVANTAVNAAARNDLNLKSLILNDLQTNNEDKYDSISFYGKIWTNFQEALEAEGCAYWGRLYKNIFESDFKLDQEALERRINVPKEMRDLGAASVASYLEALEKGATRYNEARIIILGDKGAGKTCIARRLIDPKAPMTTEDESTAGVDTLLWTLEQDDIKVRIWDFAGHTVTHAVHQFFLSERCLYLMVYNGRTEEKNSLECWLNQMKNYGGDSKAIILVNERDQHGANIKTNFLKEHYPIIGIYHFSIRDDVEKLQAFRENVADYIKTNPSWENQLIPSNYYKVKNELEALFSKDEKHKAQEHISRAEFNQIAEQYDVEDKENLLQALHCLGVSLWYKNMAGFDTLVLNPEWISHGVYEIINWVHGAKKYALTLTDFTTVFAEDTGRYPEDKHQFLFELMMHYELAYKTEEGNQLIIPHLLNEDRPKELPLFSVGESLMLRYKAEQPLPPNTISRFIVRHNQKIKKDPQEYSVWRYGVILEDGQGSLALVREEDRTISVSVKGEYKTSFIAELRTTLNDIFNSYKSDKPELQYRIERFGEIPDELEAKYPVWLLDRQVLNQSNDNVPYYDDITRQNIDLNKVTNIFNINKGNLINGNAIVGGKGNQVLMDKSKHTTFIFHDCNIKLQGNLNDLAQLLTEAGEKEQAIELKNTAKALEQLEQCNSKDEVKKKGLANRLQRLVENLGDKDSKLGKTVKGIENAIKITQDIAKGYNKIAEWVGLPQVPTPLL